jgi:hypothetical protein
MIHGNQQGRSGPRATVATPVVFTIAAVLLLACLGDIGHAPAHERDACALAKAERYRTPAALDLSALPAGMLVLAAPTPMVFAAHQTLSEGHPNHVADAPAPRAPPRPSPPTSS